MVDEDQEDDPEIRREDWDEPVETPVASDTRFGDRPVQVTSHQSPAGERRSLQHLWLVSYSDLMTILMIFFLGLYGYTVLAKASMVRTQARAMTYSEFAASIGQLKSSLGEGLQIQEDNARVTLRLSDQVLFASGQAELSAKALTSLAEIATSLTLVDGDIIVEGHTDNVPIRSKKYRSNWELSAARAFSVIESLSRSGVPAKRMAAWGFGENRPLGSNGDDVGRAKNRRIEIVLIKKETEPRN